MTSCYQSQNYKIWKQFTTIWVWLCIGNWLLSITKLQNLKAIHNRYRQWGTREFVVINHKTTKFESNSQLAEDTTKTFAGCYQSQNYKIWKQFTTKTLTTILSFTLLSITKLQNLKAIHNERESLPIGVHVVINHKTTKFESNSQHKCLIYQKVQQ